MLTVLSNRRRVCNGLTRRELLQAGGAGLFGLSLPQVLAAEAAQQPTKARAKSVIFVYLFGGPSQLETFDCKPNAPSHIVGPFKTTATATPGLRFCEHLPMLAKRSNDFCLIRTLNHPQNDHNASHYIQTGHPMPPAERGPSNVNAAPNDWPAIGSVINYLDRRNGRPGHRTIPSYVYLPNRHGEIQLGGQYDRLGQYAGWLGSEYNAFATRIHKRKSGDNPYYRDCTDEELKFRFTGLELNKGITVDRLNRRQSLLAQFDQSRRALTQSRQVEQFGDFRREAFEMVMSDRLRQALNLQSESAKLRDRYGRNLFGQSLIVGRRMIEAGARFTTVIWDMSDGADSGWDSHDGLTASLRDHLLPGLDRGFSALLDDLRERGLLDDTLVVCCGEMGRTPQFLNRGNSDGRDHWSYCFPAILAGAGIKDGLVYGQSDRHAAYPLEKPVSPEDLTATIFHSLGINPHTPLLNKQGQPVALVNNGHIVQELFS
ncbi:MAG TPA: DUF1501 domain-containing protein [Planctomycetaceae bacterium]|nr:DUF1501 domain-containing protein [Planctomycetaceae bacterium]